MLASARQPAWLCLLRGGTSILRDGLYIFASACDMVSAMTAMAKLRAGVCEVTRYAPGSDNGEIQEV